LRRCPCHIAGSDQQALRTLALDQLASEDALRLAVLLAGELHAVRIDEGTLTLHALTPRGEARIALHPDTRAERYLVRVREALAGAVMGSPGGYPVHLRRWTRSGHASPSNLAALLCLAEPEAVTAVSLSAQLTDELARRVWWLQADAPTARAMLAHAAVRRGPMGPVLAAHLLDYLPFEEDPDAAIASIDAVAAAGLLDQAARDKLWRAAQHRPHYLIGWLQHAPQTLPPEPARALPPAVEAAAAQGDALAALLCECATPGGQAALRAIQLVLDRLPTHQAAYRMLDLIGQRFAAARDAVAAGPAVPAHLAEALRTLAATGAPAAEPVLSRTTAVGPLMRRHLAPLLQTIGAQLKALRDLA
jgi:hypothetical protein